MNKTEQLRNLPSVDEVLRRDEIATLHQQHSHRRLGEWVRQAIQNCRDQILAGSADDPSATLATIIGHVMQLQKQDSGQSIVRVINATGVVLHTNLGRAPLAPRAIDKMNEAARYANVELDLQSGRRSKRGARVASLVAQLVGAEDAVIVNNCAGATMLVLQSIAAGREVIVSRGQLVEIGGGFRLPDVFRSAGVHLREVGTTNRTYLRDYESAIGEQTGAIIRVHRSNFQLTGFVTEPSIDELVTIDRPDGVPVIDDLGSGCIEDLSALGLHEPTVPASVRSGADLTLFSGDKLFGGPQCGMIVGRADWIERLRTSPMMRAMRCDKLTLAALEATVEIHLDGDAISELPALEMLALEPSRLRQRCEELRDRIGIRADVEITACESPVGGGSVPGATLPGFALKIQGAGADRLAGLLRDGTPAVQTRVVDDAVLVDVRTVAEDELEPLADRMVDCFDRIDHEDDVV